MDTSPKSTDALAADDRHLALAQEELRQSRREIRAQADEIKRLREANADTVRASSMVADLAELATLPQRCDTVDATLTAAAQLCASIVDHAVDVTVTLGPPHEPAAITSTSDRAQILDGAQLTAGEGPSIAAWSQSSTMTSPDLADDSRWPRLASCVPPHASVPCVAAVVDHGSTPLGTLSVYGADERHTERVEVFAVALAAMLSELDARAEVSRLTQDMAHALSSRSVIEQAKGVVMAQRGGTPDEAWHYLVELSSTQHVKVRDLARRIVEGGAARGMR